MQVIRSRAVGGIVAFNQFEPFLSDATVTEQLKFYHFFRTLKNNGIISGLSTAFEGTLLERLNANKAEHEPIFTARSFNNVSLVDYSKFKAGADLCERVKREMHYVRIHPTHVQFVKEAYEFYYKEKFDPLPGDDFDLFRRRGTAEPRGPKGEIRLDGDYLMFRVEQRVGTRPQEIASLVSRNFVRFFPHKDKGTRFMMLSMASINHPAAKNKYLGAKGWVDNIEDRYLASGQVISRNGPDVTSSKIHGGMSTLVVEAEQSAPFVLSRDHDSDRYTIEAAACLHLRAIYGAEPSLSRGYLVRCKGVEKLGGQDDQIQSQRYTEIRNLQELLAKELSSDLSVTDAAQILSTATHYAAEAFYRVDENQQPHGLLVNIPFAQQESASPFNWPIMLPSTDAPIWSADYPARRIGQQSASSIGITINV